VDIALPSHGVVIEIDGPSHFAANCQLPLGPTLMKRRHLAAQVRLAPSRGGGAHPTSTGPYVPFSTTLRDTQRLENPDANPNPNPFFNTGLAADGRALERLGHAA